MNNKIRINLQLISAILLILVGCGLLIAGFIVAPLGIIVTSVLTAFGEASTFAGALFGIDYTYKYKINHINKQIEKETQDKQQQ